MKLLLIALFSNISLYVAYCITVRKLFYFHAKLDQNDLNIEAADMTAKFERVPALPFGPNNSTQ